MSNKKIFWGIFFLTIGTIFLLVQLDIIENDFSSLISLWPLVLILWGIYFFNIPEIIRKILSGTLALILALIFVTIVINPFNTISFLGLKLFSENDNKQDDTTKTYKFSDSLSFSYDEKIKIANLTFESGAGKITLSDTTEKLIELFSKSSWSNYKSYHSIQDSISNIEFYLFEKGKPITLSKNTKHNATLMLNPKPIWSINLNIGAMKLDFDLTKFKIKDIDISAGATDINLKLGNKIDTATVKIQTGASSVNISIPKEIACEIKTELGLASRSFKDFVEVEEDIYRTENFSTSQKVIFIEIEGGLSSFKVVRY